VAGTSKGRLMGTLRSARAIRAGALTLITTASLAGALLVPPLAQARTEAPVTVGPAEVSTALFVAGDVARLSKGPAGNEDVVLEKALQQMYADEPALAPGTAESYVSDMQALLAASSAPSQASLQLMAGNQRIIAILAALERPYGSPSVGLPAAAKLAVTHLAAVALSGSSDIFAGAEEPRFFEPLADARTNLLYTAFAPAAVLRATHELAGGNHRFGEARDALWRNASEESVFSQWSELLKESKVLQSEALKEVRGEVEAGNGTITAEPQALTALFTNGQVRTQEQSCEHNKRSEEEIGASTINGVPRLDCSGGALYEAAHAPRACTKECEAELARRQSLAEKREQVIAEERATMVAAAELLRPSDNTAATLQDATAQAQAQITEEETAYAEYEAQKAEKEAIAKGVQEGLEAGTAVLALGTGNYSEGVGGLIGVGFELYENIEGGLSHPPPGPQEITLQDLADLSTQLSGFQEYTQEAFHAINTQLAQLSSQLARENYELKEQLSELGERLQREQGTIFALQDQVRELFSAETKANLQSTIEDSVGWLQRTGESLAPAKVQEALVALKKFATEIANGPLVNSAEIQPYTLEGAYRELTSKTTGEPTRLSEDTSYLARFPGEAEWVSGLVPTSLANTTFWAESSRAYAQLMLENASHASAPDIAGLKELEREGAKLETAQSAWSQPSAGAGANAILEKALLDLKEAAYGNGVEGTASVKGLLQEKAEAFFEQSLERDVKLGIANPTTANLWGGATQSFDATQVYDAKYPALKWKECSGSEGKNGEVEMPEAFIGGLPAALVNGVRLGVIGAPGSGAPLVLEACRTITGAEESKAQVTEKSYESREVCPNWGGVRKDCEVADVFKSKSETNDEAVTETLALTESGSRYVLASPTSCVQDALHWRGTGELYTEDATTKTKESFYEGTAGAPFAGERHVGTVDLYGASIKDSGSEVEWGPEATQDPYAVFEGGLHCPYEGSEETAGVEYSTYGGGESPLGTGSQMQQSALVEKIDARLSKLQQEAYGEGLKALSNPPVGDPSASLGGARALVQSYVKLGFPQAVDSNLALQSDVDGLGAQFLDPEPGSPRPLPAEVNALVVNWIQRLKGASGSTLQSLLQEDLIEEVRSRSSKWAAEIAEQLRPYIEGKVAGFGSATEAISERAALVESTLNRLQLTRDVLTEARAPTAETLAPSEVGMSEATVRGEVEPNGGAVEACMFEYGATDTYGQSVACSTTPGANDKAVVVSAKIPNWTPEGSFHERVVMRTWGGTSYGEDVKVQLAQSTHAPSGALILANTSTPGATISGLTAEALPAGLELPAGAEQIVGALAYTVNVTPGGSARVKIELPAGSVPNALFKLRHTAAGGEGYVEIPSSLYTITGSTIELTLVDGGADDEDGEVNGKIVDPLVPAVMTKQPATSSPPPSTPSPPTSTAGSQTTPTPKPTIPRECVSNGSVTVHLADLKPPRGATIAHSEILVGGRVVARLGGGATAAVVSFAGLRKGHYEVTLVAWLSNGKTLRRRMVFHPCAPAALTARQCVSNGSVTVYVSDLKLLRGATFEQSEILVHGHVVASLGSRATAAVVSFAGQRSGPYEVTLVAKLRDRRTLRRKVLFGACSAGRR
jgi:hypothetical protein